MNETELKRIIPRASKTTIALNCKLSGADAESPVRDGPLAKKKGKDRHPRKCLVRITSYRVRRADAEGLCGKYFVDALRYSGILYEDTEEYLVYQITQKKVEKKTQEKTLIEVEAL